jgi:hypothetical protein
MILIINKDTFVFIVTLYAYVETLSAKVIIRLTHWEWGGSVILYLFGMHEMGDGF